MQEQEVVGENDLAKIPIASRSPCFTAGARHCDGVSTRRDVYR